MCLNVYVSNPSRKKERTDAGIEQREIYIAGLARSTTESELRELFSECGPIKSARLPLDENGGAKGFGFVEFEHETAAWAALSYNNREIKRRRIAVTIVDPRARGRKDPPASGLGLKGDIISRSVRLKGLPKGLEEGILQQIVEKVVTGVKKVEIFRDICEAVVEFETIAGAGKMLLLPNGLTVEGIRVDVGQDTVKARETGRSSLPTAPTAFTPRAASKPKARLGLGTSGPPGTAPKRVQFISSVNGPTSSSPIVNTPSSTSAAFAKSQDAFRAMLEGKK